jgi:aldose 1-epimerase
MNNSMNIQKSDFGKTHDGIPVELYTLTNKNGLVAKVINYGAILTELQVPDKNGKMADVVLGFADLPDYLDHSPFFGATAGRYANRIADAQFTLNGKTYHLFANNGPTSLHGGKKGFDKQIWKAEPKETSDGPSVKFTYLSPDGEENYPGNLNTTCTYTLTNDNALKIEFTATTDKPTVLNLTNHTYWNLGGESSGSILDEVLTINADRYTPVDQNLIPTGELKPVAGTPMDFRKPMPIGSRIDQVPGGYDHNYVLNSPGPKPGFAARLEDPKTGRVMEVLTTQPGVQLYTANHLDGKVAGIGGKPYEGNGAVCLETQHFPDSPNHPDFPTTVLNPGEKFDQVTIYKFSAE